LLEPINKNNQEKQAVLNDQLPNPPPLISSAASNRLQPPIPESGFDLSDVARMMGLTIANLPLGYGD
jgi:hypothetical protein